MITVRVNASRQYDVAIGEGLLDRAGEYALHACGVGTAAVVTDETVGALYGRRLIDSLRGSGFDVVVCSIKGGEASKNTRNYLALLDFLADNRLTRSDVVVALGGGVVGDLAGFAAATYLRGIPFVQIPTTLLAAVDSSVGGKTGVDLAAGKNLAGAFHQPSLVLCDYVLLDTLPPRVFADGCAEIVKYAMIADAALFNRLKAWGRGAETRETEAIISACVAIKRDLVCIDEYDRGLRKLLNFGHTAGHAIERLSDYSITHGEAVSIGMAIMTRAAVAMGKCGKACADELVETIKSYGLPTQSPYGTDELSNAALSDKKRSGAKITIVLPEAIGRCVLQEIYVEELGYYFGKGLTAN
jgi:3-dehydroquinate synthase